MFDMELITLPAVRIALGLIIGLVLGSFVTMLSYRLPRRMSIISPPSTCPNCKTRLTPRDLIPIFSWLINKGRCRHCATPIGARYVVIEIVTALFITTAFAILGYGVALLIGVIAMIGVITATIIMIEK